MGHRRVSDQSAGSAPLHVPLSHIAACKMGYNSTPVWLDQADTCKHMYLQSNQQQLHLLPYMKTAVSYAACRLFLQVAAGQGASTASGWCMPSCSLSCCRLC
jgi:hypothetical protein